MRRWLLPAIAAVTIAVPAASAALAATTSPSAARPPAPAAVAATATPAHAGPAASSSGSTVVSFTYAPQVLVQLDAAGRLWRVKTNTGKPPARADQLDVADVSGTPVTASAALRAAVAAASWAGDWSAVGTWHPWPSGP